MSLNVGRFLDERTARFFMELSDSKSCPDVLLLQDFPISRIPLLCKWPHLLIAPMTIHVVSRRRDPVGVLIASRFHMTNISSCIHHGDGVLRNLDGINGDGERLSPDDDNDRLIEGSENRIAVFADIRKGDDTYSLGTTHGFWVGGGKTNDRQRKSVNRLLEILDDEANERHKLVFAGDLNFGRAGQFHQQFRERWEDCMPEHIETTLDPDHSFSKNGGKVVTDQIWDCTPRSRVGFTKVSRVQLRAAVSDHQAVFFTVSP